MDKTYLKATLLLCSYGFFLYIKPSEPFLTPYLLGPVHNLTDAEVVNEIYPVWTYSYLALLLPVFILTDYLKYKPVIIFQGIGHIACWLVLLFGRGVPWMQFMQVCYAVATAGEVGYYSYIYSIVDESYYQKVTSYVRSSTLFGYFVASLLSQLLVSVAHLDYFYLNIISLINVSIAFIISWFLPMPKTTMFFYTTNQEPKKEDPSISNEKSDDVEEKLDPTEEKLASDDSKTAVDTEEESKKILGTSFHSPAPKPSLKTTLIRLWMDIKLCYSNPTLVRWSVWWAFSTCGWLLVVNYIQNLWETIRSSSEHDVYNGAVECVATVLGALGAFVVGYITVDWMRWGELSLGLCSLVKCGLLMIMYWTNDIIVCYVAYVTFICLYNVVITITQFQLAIGLTTSRFALVFGVNTFAALALNSLLTLILIDKAGLGLNVETQFIVYSVYFGIIALIFLGHSVYFFCKLCLQRRKSLDQEVNPINEAV